MDAKMPRKRSPLLVLVAGATYALLVARRAQSRGEWRLRRGQAINPTRNHTAEELQQPSIQNSSVVYTEHSEDEPGQQPEAALSGAWDEACPPCSLLFTKVGQQEEGTPVAEGGTGTRVQSISLMERGEPKSGTGFMFEWAGGSLVHACDYLKATFGEDTCKVDWAVANDVLGDLMNMDMLFDPHLAEEPRCPCEGVDRVSISIRRHNKHQLPLVQHCPLSHVSGIVGRGNSPCIFPDGTKPTNYIELWNCMKKIHCPLEDKRQQMVTFRDPRPMVVSTYFFLVEHNMVGPQPPPIDEYVTDMLPTLCQWMAVRYILFDGTLANQSDVYWYEDAVADPLEWHYRWLASVGLQMPAEVVEGATSAAARHDYVFPSKGVDAHPGGDAPEHRSYTDEISAETLAGFDDVLRTWLPPVLLARLGVPES